MEYAGFNNVEAVLKRVNTAFAGLNINSYILTNATKFSSVYYFFVSYELSKRIRNIGSLLTLPILVVEHMSKRYDHYYRRPDQFV